ncbi:MAG: cytochrome c family protein, partial [Thermoanaerobaculia bacterium]
MLVAASAVGAGAAQELPFLEHARVDPRQVMTAEACGECHLSEHAVWKATPHATGFRTLHKKEQALTIAGKLGFRLIKRDSICFSCHYTPIVEREKIRVDSGVSCESCHGAGRDWIKVHNDYGDGFDHRSEPAAHRRERIEASRRAGMRRPSDLYPVVANCYSCHTVPNEELVNVAGHTTGSSDFEFVEWSQGEIRHNFLQSTLAGSSPANAERPMGRKRVMYVVGRALDLEYSLRGVAEA